MHFKRMAVLCLALCALLCCAQAQTADAPKALDEQELSQWVTDVLESALAGDDKPVITKVEDGYTATYPAFTLTLDSDTPDGKSVVRGITMGVSEDCDEVWNDPRGISPTNSLSSLLSAYRNDNTHLSGTRDEAVLYGERSSGMIQVGIVHRDGQNVTAVEYAYFSALEDGVEHAGLLYTIRDGSVIEITAFGLSQMIPYDEAEALISHYEQVSEASEYFMYPTENATPFEREDLSFSGLDLLDVTPQDAVAALGAYTAEEWVQDSNGEKIRKLQWDDVQLTFIYTADEKLLYADMIVINGDSAEGPRGVKTGDRYDSVYRRFQHNGMAEYQGTQVLYGDADSTVYGMSEVEGTSATLRYSCMAGEKQAMLLATFESGRLQSMLIFVMD